MPVGGGGACDAYYNQDGVLVIPICFDATTPDYSGGIFVPSPPGLGSGGGSAGAPFNPSTGSGDWPASTIDLYLAQSAGLTQSQLDARCSQWGGFWCPVAERRRTPAPSPGGPTPIISTDASIPLTFAGVGAVSPFAAKPAPRRAPPRRAPMRRKPAPKKPTPRPRRPLPSKKPPLPEQPIRWLPKVAPKVLRVAGRAFGLLANLIWPSDLGDPENASTIFRRPPPGPKQVSSQPVIDPRRDTLAPGVLPEVTIFARSGEIPSSARAYDPSLSLVTDPFADVLTGVPKLSLATPAPTTARPSVRDKTRPSLTSPLDTLLSGGSSLPRKVPRSTSPLKPGFLELPAPSPTPKEELDRCKQQRKKRAQRKARTECWRGTYIERATGLSKTRREKVPCQ